MKSVNEQSVQCSGSCALVDSNSGDRFIDPSDRSIDLAEIKNLTQRASGQEVATRDGVERGRRGRGGAGQRTDIKEETSRIFLLSCSRG